MGESDVEVIDVLSSTPLVKTKKKKKQVLVDCDSEVKHIGCLKNADDLRRFEETEDCFIIDFAPLDLSKLFDAHDDQNAPEIAVVYETGQVACRDYPHSRHLCLKFPFATTVHKSHCNMCYCYVCDTPAPCSRWAEPSGSHCDACGGGDWETLRSGMRKFR